MGLDFLDRTKGTFERSCQRGYEDLTRVRLFDPGVRVHERLFVARFNESFEIPPGGEFLLRAEGDRIVVYCDERPVGVGENPPQQILEKLQFADQGVAVGRVEATHTFSHAADIAVE